MSISIVSSYYIRLESPTSQSHQQLLLTPQLDESYQLHPQQIVPLYRFEYPNQQILYYNPQTVQSTAGLHTLNYDHFNRLVNAQPVQAQEINDESNEAVTIENADFRSPINYNNAYYAVNNEENPPVFYGDIDPQTGHPTSTIFSMQQLQPVERDETHETSRDNERKETSTTMSSEEDSAETTTTLPATTSPATTTMRIIVEEESMEEEEEISTKIAPQTTTESSVEDVEDLITKEIALREQKRTEDTMSNGPPRQGSDESIASAKPSALALAGVGGVASAKPRGTALTGMKYRIYGVDIEINVIENKNVYVNGNRRLWTFGRLAARHGHSR